MKTPSENKLRSPSHDDGDTAPRRGPAWTLGGVSHTHLEDAILENIDLERGHLPRRITVRNGGMRGILVDIPEGEKIMPQLNAFVEHLVEIMCHSPENGGRSATQAYVIAREMQMVLREGKRHNVSISPEGAKSFQTELEGFLPKKGLKNQHREIMVLLHAIAEARRARRVEKRRDIR